MTRANLRRRMGRWTESAADYGEAARLDPTAYGVQLEFGNTLLLMRRYAEARMALEQARLVAPDAVDPIVWLAALAVRERMDTVSARRLINQALPHVNAHALVARIVQSFPELVRAIPDSLRSQMREFSLRDAYGDSALLHVIRAELEPTVPRRRAHLDSAATILAGRIAKNPDALAAHRVLSAVRLAQGNAPEALRLARRALEIMPPSRDAHAAMQGLVILAEAEIRSGARDSARVHLRQLLEQPSVLTPALVATDPVWRLAGLPNR